MKTIETYNSFHFKGFKLLYYQLINRAEIPHIGGRPSSFKN